MAVLAPERADPGPREPETPSPSRRWPLPRPRRDGTPALPDDGRLSWVLTAVLGVVSLATRLWGISYPTDKLFDEAYYPPEAHE
ncbi:MAG TPA: phospholipid carrier-dependent glycosyltransferase, partial [Blastococcus sp.]